jgi:hypothetical protein
MNRAIKALAVLLFVLTAPFAFATEGSFDEALNECMQTQGAEFIECARVAALRTGSEQLEVRYEMDLATGEPNINEVEVCNLDRSGHCTLFDCVGSGSQYEMCRRIGVCVEAVNVSECVYD